MQLCPLTFKPIFKQRIWGGRKLAELFGKELPQGEKIGESWELADLPDDKSVVTNGPLADKALHEVLQSHTLELMGRDDYSGSFPLLIKLLDCQDILSVQVHPDPQACKRMGKGEPKTECWYIISAEPGSVIYKGLKQGVTKEQFATAIEKGNVDELLAQVEVRPGECHLLPAGTVHAIGAGLVIAEIQTPSDTTYRVFDWNRLDDSHKPRPLHIPEALESIDFDAAGAELAVATVGRLAECEYFKVDKGHQLGGEEVLLSPTGPTVLLAISGAGTIISGNCEPVAFEPGRTVLVPADFEGFIRFEKDTEYLQITV